ncbi:hypothetical protein BSPLISOX_540 [uncultured Gammaproteobacteria bacterium]|nr:hypothetical protein [uncultured Gammaproteobacteria bacterium]CAC9455085.1 hypothetical protein [uncultured Gammaproteobacteria bacterium]VVH66819.1 hypothetical protein BSPLISOX_540 [uncultured Gammaproteobacteria bacterium]
MVKHLKELEVENAQSKRNLSIKPRRKIKRDKLEALSALNKTHKIKIKKKCSHLIKLCRIACQI